MAESTSKVNSVVSFRDRVGRLFRRKKRWQIIGVVAIVIVWEIAGQFVGSYFLAPASETIVVFAELIAGGRLIEVAIPSLRQMLIGYGIAIAFGIPVGLMMGQSRKLENLLDPWVSALFVTSTAALIPFFIVVFGIDFQFRVAIVWISAQWHILLEMFGGSKELRGNYDELAESFGTSRFQKYVKILLPGSIPFTMVALRLGLGRAIKGMVLAEMFVVVGYGGFLIETARFPSKAHLQAALLGIMSIAVGGTFILKLLGKQVAPWYDF